jgi:hypothetical protein
MRFRLRLVKKTTGELSSIQKPCGSWTHQACAERKAEKAIEAFLRHWEGLDVVYFVSVPTNPSTFDRLRKRRQGKVVQWVTVRRTDGTTHLYSSRFLPGPECPETWVEINPEAGLQLFAGQSVALPGVDRLSSKPSWQPVSVHVSGVNVSLGGVPDAIWERAVDAAADRLRVEFGTQVEPGEPLPPEVPVQDWIDVLAEEIEREREAHAHPLVPPEPHVYSYQEEED